VPVQNNRDLGSSSNRLGDGIDQRALRQAQQQCRRLAKSHYENFLVASVLLPRRLRQPFFNVYAYCRTADDLADESPSPQEALRRLDEFQQQLDRTFAGRPPANLFTALADTIDRFELPKQPFADLLSAFRQDQTQLTYQTFDQLEDYCRRSANPVGRIVLKLGDALSDQTAQLSDQICTGLQLANFWQDVARDRAIGRTYVPQAEMDRFAVTDSMLAAAETSPPLRKLLASECDRAERLLHSGLGLTERVPPWLGRNVKLFAHGGLATLTAIRNINFDVLRVRPTVSKRTQLGLVCRAMLGRL
jgi:squalene synthase HpnC